MGSHERRARRWRQSSDVSHDEPHSAGQESTRCRARDLGLAFGDFLLGGHNAITDVTGVDVGHATIIDAQRGVYSGVTAVVPRALGDHGRLAAGLFIANGYGKFVGATQVVELGEIETPVLLTSTLSTFRVADAALTWLLDRTATPPVSVNPVVAEINDSWLSGVGRRHVQPVAMGNVGGGTGACALGFKAGIGSSSRIVPAPSGDLTVGVLVQANMDGVLRVGARTVTPRELGLGHSGPPTSHGSCVVLVALDRDVSAHQLRRIAARALFALGRVGADFGHGSGDYGLAFASTRSVACQELTAPELDLVFRATMDAVEEAVVDCLLAADTIEAPNGRRAAALPHDAVTTRAPA
jgi:D-aminopeptidase